MKGATMRRPWMGSMATAPIFRRLGLAGFLAMAMVASCGDSSECGDNAPCTSELRGYVRVGNELWAFQRCNSQALISVNVTGNEPGFERLDTALSESMGCTDQPDHTRTCVRAEGTAYVEMMANVSAPGSYAGGLQRELTMQQIHAASAAGPSDCAQLAPVLP